MSTKLESLVVRESSETADDRNILIALTEDQRVSLRLKGMKSGTVSIGIKALYDYLNGNDAPAGTNKPVSIKKQTVNKDEPMISLYRLRSLNATTPSKAELLVRMDELLVDLIDEVKKEQS